MADEKNENALGVQTDQSQSDNQAAAPQGPSPAEDLADLVPVNESEKPLAGAHPESATADLVPVSGTEKKLSLPENQTIQASGVIGPTSIGPRDSNFHNWLQDVQSDVKNGSSSTWVGAMLKKFGAKGTTYGVNPEIGDLMAGPVLGVPKALEGTSEIAEQLDEGVRNSNMDYDKTVRGINKVVGGVLGSVAIPAMIAAPGGEALAVAVPAMIAQSQAEKAAKYMGADDDTAELVGNVAGLYAGGRIHASQHPVVERFGVAVNSRTAAEQEYSSRSRELETARGQAAEMQQRAHEAAQKETTGQGTPAETDVARTTASEATKNVANAQKAFDQAAARRADATIQLEKLGRQITKSADKTTAAEYESRASEQKKASDLFRKAVPSKGANQYTPEDEDIARAHMEEAKNGGAKIVDLPTAYEAVEGGRQGIEDKLQPHLEKYADESLTDKPEDSPKIQVAQKLDEMAKVDGNFANAMDSLSEFNITDPSVKEGQEMLTKLNNYNRAAMKSANNWDIYNMIETKPDFAARFFMADALRDALYNKLEQHGIEGAREARSETASLIRVRDAIGAQIRANRGGTTVRGSGTQSKMRLLTAKLTGKAIKGAGIAGGAEVGGPVGAVAGGALGEMAAQPVEDFLAPRDMTRDQHIEKSMKYKGTNRKPVQIKGTGSPAVPVPTEPIPPPVKLAPESLELTPRENTELHAELAAHYGESNLEDSTYAELEKQLRDDVAAKNRSGVALDPAEKTLLTKILKADSADRAITQAAGKPGVEVKIDPKKEDEIIKEADQRAEEGEPTKLNPHLVSLGRGDESALVAHSPAMKAHAPAMVVPGLPNGMTTDDAHLHEWAHTAIGAVDGLEPVEIRSDIHPKSEKGAGATAVFNGASIRDADGNIDPEGLSKQETQWLTQKMAGPASHEVFKGMTREEVKAHPSTRSDFRQSRAIVREVHPDFTPSQVEAVVDAAYDRARDFLTKPHIADRIRANAAVREEGLSHTLHASHGRVNQFAEDIRNAHSEYTGGESGPDGGGAGEVSEKAEKPAAEGEEKNAGRDKGGSGKGTPKPAVKVAATSGEPKVKLEESKITQAPELRVPFKEGRTNPPERTTGEHDEAIKKGGGIPGGIQQGDKEIGLKDLALFHDPTTGSTLALPTDMITAENVKAQLQKSRDQYLKARPEESRIPTPGQAGYDEEIHGTGRSNEPATDDLVGQAVKHYGTTDEPRKTGYILPDGRGLDFSDGQKVRTLDHGDVSEVMKTERGENPRAAFTNKTGALRFLQSSFGTEVVVPESGATDEQMKFISDAALQHPRGSKELSIDLLSGSGEIIGSARRDIEGVSDVQRTIADARRSANQRTAPADLVESKIEKAPEVAKGADEYNEEHGFPAIDALPKPHNVEFAKRVADAFDQMKHEPNNPEVQKAYNAMANEVRQQWDYATQKMGMKFEPWTKEGQPYANSSEMADDVRNNKHLYFFQGGDLKSESPMAKVDPETGLTSNDMFRAVHDLFGHAAHGFEFGPKGEENAYLVHRQMFSPEAIPALTSETRGQNSWVNFGKHLRDEAGNVPKKGEAGYVPQTQRPYAEQKVGLLPKELQGGTGEVTPEMVEQSQMSTSPEHQKRVDDAKWEVNPNSGYRLLKVTDSDGTPMGAVAHDNYRMRMAHIYDPYLNKGVGKAMYERAFEDAKNNGAKELMSDTSLSKDAARVWDSLAKEGKYNITSEPSNEVNRSKSGEGVLRTQYTVHLDEPKLNPEESEIRKGPKGSSVPLMDNPLPVKGTGDNGEVNTLDITKALNKFSRKQNPALEPGSGSGQMVERARKIAEDEAKYQLAQSKTGTEWYTTEMKDHDKVLQDLRPELAEGEKTDSLPDHPVNLTLFKAAEAILSSGQKPYANVKSAMRAWDHYKETGEFAPTNPANGKSWGPRNVAAYGNAFESMNRLIKEKGEKGAADWLLAEHPVSELKQYNPEGVSGKKTDEAAGAMILGQKRGPFMQNLHGIESKFTADMWVSRTWNRWMGTLDLDPRIEDKGKVTSESDVPRNNAERSLMKESFEKTAQKLNLTTSSLQAVLWYYEQALYRAHGIPVESWSFSDAAKRVAAEQKAVPEAEQTGFNFGANKDKKAEGGLANMAGTVKPKAAGAVHAFDFLNALKNKK